MSEDLKRHLQMLLTLTGAALALGAIAGAAFSAIRISAGVLDDTDPDQ